MNPYPRQTQHTDLRPAQIEAAADYRLRLNPSDRLTVDQLDRHRWLVTAFMGGDS